MVIYSETPHALTHFRLLLIFGIVCYVTCNKNKVVVRHCSLQIYKGRQQLSTVTYKGHNAQLNRLKEFSPGMQIQKGHVLLNGIRLPCSFE